MSNKRPAESGTPDMPSTLLRVAWMSILLGLGMELLLLAVAAGFGKQPAVKAALADLVQKVSWSSIVCAGLALGTATSRLRPQFMGLAGAVAAPVAFTAARAFHKGAVQALAVAAPAAGNPSPFVLAAIKAIEYALLGILLGRLAAQPGARLRAYAATGLAVGAVFGAGILFLAIRQTAAPIPLLGLVSRGLNEAVFPVGCSLVIYASTRVGAATAKR